METETVRSRVKKRIAILVFDKITVVTERGTCISRDKCFDGVYPQENHRQMISYDHQETCPVQMTDFGFPLFHFLFVY